MFAWDDLKYFLAFARGGSLQAAAKAEGVNYSTIQRRLSELEERLGHRLIERDLSGYRLTELGKDLVQYAEGVEHAVAAFERRIASSKKELTGVIRVTCAPTVGARLKKTSLIETFESRFPGLQVELVMSDRMLDLSKGEADIAIRSRTSEPEDNEALVGRKLADLPWALYASLSYVGRYGRPQGIREISQHSVIKCTMANNPPTRWLSAVAPHAKLGACTESWSGLVLALKSGAGLAPLPLGHGDTESELVRVIDDIPELVTQVYLLTHKDIQHAPRVRAFFDFANSEIKAFREFLTGQTSLNKDRQSIAPALPTG